MQFMQNYSHIPFGLAALKAIKTAKMLTQYKELKTKAKYRYKYLSSFKNQWALSPWFVDVSISFNISSKVPNITETQCLTQYTTLTRQN